MVVHLQDTPAAARTMMRPIRLSSLTFPAVADISCGFNHDGSIRYSFRRRKGSVGIMCRYGRARINEDSCCVGPVEESPKGNGKDTGVWTCRSILVGDAVMCTYGAHTSPQVAPLPEADVDLDPDRPCCQSIHEG